MTEEKIVSMEEALKVYENVNGNETLKVYKDRFEIVRIRSKQEVTAIYRYYNVKSVCADKFMKGDRIVVKLVDNNELFFFLTNASAEEYQELATLLAELKENAPTIEELGISVEEGLQELKDNKEKSKSELGKKIGKFVSEYKNFKELTLANKIFHIAVPIILLILVLGMGGDGNSVIIEDNGMDSGALYNCDIDEARDKANEALDKVMNMSLEDDFEESISEDETTQYYLYSSDDGIHIQFHIDSLSEKLYTYEVYIDVNVFDLDTLGVGQELFVSMANEISDDDLTIEMVKGVVKSGLVNQGYYQNNNIYVLGSSENGTMSYAAMSCTEQVADERGMTRLDD